MEKVHDKHQNKIKLEQLKERLSKEINSRKFNLEPENFSPEVTVKHFQSSFKKDTFGCKMNQIPANSNNRTTGHKLQGMSKDVIIVTSWPTGGLSKIGSMLYCHVCVHCQDYTLLIQWTWKSCLTHLLNSDLTLTKSSKKKKVYLINAKKLCH